MTFQLQILHASDLEGGLEAIGNAPNFAALVDAFEDEVANTLVLSAGDNLISGPFFNAASDRSVRDALRESVETQFGLTDGSLDIREGVGRVDIQIMNLIGFDASALGNHEFDLGTSILADIIGTDIRDTSDPADGLDQVRWLGTQFPYLSANLDFSGDGELASLSAGDILPNTAFQSDPGDLSPDALAEAAAAPKVAPATTVDVNGELVGIVGATTPLLEAISSPGDTAIIGPTDNDMAELAAILQPVIDDLLTDGIDKIVLVTHLQQITLEQQLVSLLSGVDIVIAGGSDTLLADATDVLRPGDVAADDYPLITTNADDDPALIVSTDGEYSYLGRLVVEFDDNGVLLPESIDAAVSGAYATTDEQVEAVWGSLDAAFADGTTGSEVKKLTDAVETVVIERDSEVFGRTDVYLDGERTSVRTEETNLGNLTADANLAAAKMVDSDVVASIKNGGGIRAPIGEIRDNGDGTSSELPPQANPLSGKEDGEVSQLDIENSLRFDNGLTILTLSAEGLREVIEHGVAATGPGATPGQFAQVGGLSFSFDPDLPPGERVQSLAIIDDNGTVIDVIVADGEVIGDPAREIKIVTLDFLAGGGDGYPFDTLGTDRVDIGVGEQQALADFLAANFADTPFAEEDVGPELDTRIQNLNVREDSVLSSDNDGNIALTAIGTYESGLEDGAEIVAHDPATQQLFVVNGAQNAVDILDVSDPTQPQLVQSIDLTDIDGFDGLSSIAVKDGLLAVAISGEGEANGQVAFFTTAFTSEPTFLGTVDVGNLPDMLTFTPDGNKLLVANEGEPVDENTDPNGSVSIIDLSSGLIGATVTTLDFSDFDTEALRDAGVRIFPDKTAAEDLEPEFISVSPDGTQAFVTLQENNAVAVIDLETQTIVDVLPLGAKDHSLPGNGLDPSDRDDAINIKPVPVKGLYMPDGIASYTGPDGRTYYVTANEGDARDEDARVGELGDLLDPDALPGSLRDEDELGRLEVSTIDGDTDGDGDIDELFSYGSRSFSIWDEDGNLVFDSGDDFEQITAELVPELFNGQGGDPAEFDSRSDAKGPEPEGVAVGTIEGQTYAFIGLERVGGIMVYNVTDPANARFVQYINNPGDVAPEGLTFISAEDSPNGKPLLAVANEVSGTTTLFEIDVTDPQSPPSVFINELRTDQPDSDSDEYFELVGAPGESLDGLSYVVIGDGEGGSGVVEAVIDLTGHVIPEDGFFLAAEPTFDSVAPDLMASLNFENNDNVTHLLVRDFDAAVGDDLDTNDDGMLDARPWTSVLDSLALVGPENGDQVYSDTQIGPNGDFVPGHVFRVLDQEGEFRTGGFTFPDADTPGASNITPIYAIQGAGHVSTLAGQTVATIGIVTAVDSNRFFIQDALGDGDDTTSDGLEVFTRDAPNVAVGDEVVVVGEVSEFVPGGVDTGNLSITQIAFPSEVEVLSSGNALPEAVVLGTSGRVVPNQFNISPDELPGDGSAIDLRDPAVGNANFDPDEDGIDFFETLEGMRVTVEDPVAVSATRTFSETSSELFTLTNNGDNIAPDDARTDRGGIELQPDEQNPERVQIQFDGGILPDFVPEIAVGDSLGDVTGVLGYSFGNYEVNVTETFEVESAGLEPDVTDIEKAPDKLTVASYNVLNLDPLDGDKNQRETLAKQIVDDLKAPDIIALQEIQDNDGTTGGAGGSNVIAADATLQALVDAIVEAGGPAYEFVDNPFVADDTTGGQPGGNIRNAFLYDPTRVDLVEDSLRTVVDPTDQQTNPDNPFFDSRLPLAADFEFEDETVTVVNNHWSSRFGSTPIFGAVQPFVEAGEEARAAQAEAVNAFVDDILAEDPDADVLVLGDFNTFQFTDQLTETLPGTGDERVLTNLIDGLEDDDVYTFNFEGNSQVLDHAFVTDGLLEGAELDIVHVNVDFPRVDDSFGSDHEPLVVGLTFPESQNPTIALSVELLQQNNWGSGAFGWYNSETGEAGFIFENLRPLRGEEPVTESVNVAAEDPEDVEFFMIAGRGGGWIENLLDEDTTVSVEPGRNGDGKVIFTQEDGATRYVNAWFTDPELNRDDADHAVALDAEDRPPGAVSDPDEFDDRLDGPVGLLAWEAGRARPWNDRVGDADFDDLVVNIRYDEPAVESSAVAAADSGNQAGTESGSSLVTGDDNALL